MTVRTRIAVILALALIVAFGVFSHEAGATGQPPADDDCVTVIDVAEVWANFAPTDARAPFIGPPAWPADVQGTWIVHTKIPGGHVGPDGVYSKGNPAKGGNWFYRQAEQSHEVCPPPPDPTCETNPEMEGCEEPPCEEDMPCWDCETMGNHDCGPPPCERPKCGNPPPIGGCKNHPCHGIDKDPVTPDKPLGPHVRHTGHLPYTGPTWWMYALIAAGIIGTGFGLRAWGKRREATVSKNDNRYEDGPWGTDL